MSGISSISGSGLAAYSVSATTLASTSSALQQQSNNPFTTLDLTQTQQQQVNQILQNAKNQGLSPSQVQSQIDAVLTPSQQAQLRNELQNRPHHHHAAASNASGASGTSDDTSYAFGVSTSTSSQIISDIATTFSVQE